MKRWKSMDDLCITLHLHRFISVMWFISFVYDIFDVGNMTAGIVEVLFVIALSLCVWKYAYHWAVRRMELMVDQLIEDQKENCNE